MLKDKGARFLICDPQRRPRGWLANPERRNRHTGRYLDKVFFDRGLQIRIFLHDILHYRELSKYGLSKYEIPPARLVSRI